MNHVFLVVPGHLGTLTGGYEYDRRMVGGLRDRGWTVSVRELTGSFPRPSSAALEDARRTLAEIPDDATVLVDGLALGAMPAEAEREASRLRLVAIVHHPLAEETGLDPRTAVELAASERRSLTAVRLVIVTSEATASMLKKYGVERDRIVVIEPGTDPAAIATGSKGPDVQLLCVATLVPRKGHETLVSALAGLAQLRWRLTCVGSLTRDPPTVDRVRSIVRASGIDERVQLVGEVEGAPLAAYYDGGDVFVLPTFYEGYGMAVANALARGLPIVSTSTGAIPSLVGADSTTPAGILVPPGDRNALASALTRLIDDPGLREQYARGARTRRGRLSTWEAQSEKLASIIDRVNSDG